MNKKNVKDYHDKMRSEYDSGDYRSAQRTAGSFLGELIGDAVNGIGNIITGGRKAREAREREERERQERLRREREAAERRRKIKIFLIVIIIVGIVISGFFILKNVFGKSKASVEKSTDITEVIEGESLPGESLAGEDVENAISENEIITTDQADAESEVKKNSFSVKDFANKLITKIADKLQSTELYSKITDIPQQRNLLYIIGYSLLTLWLGVGGIFLLTFILRVIIAIFKRKYWRKAGSSLLSSFLVFISITVLYYAFRNIFERSVTEVNFSNVLTIIAFAIFLFSNKIIINLLRAKNGNAYWGTAFKMIITAIVVYIPVIILIGRY